MAETAPRITEALLSAGHDGRAELVVVVAYANGATARVRLDEEAAEPVLEAAGVLRIEDLVGRPWDILAPALPTSEPTGSDPFVSAAVKPKGSDPFVSAAD